MKFEWQQATIKRSIASNSCSTSEVKDNNMRWNAFGIDADELYFEHAGRQERLIGIQGGGSVIEEVLS